jgi:hypothetical protein
MPQSCQLAFREKIGAIYTVNKLILWATGTKPTPCHSVRIRRNPVFIFPPRNEFYLEACSGDEICTQVITPYKVSATFGGPAAKEVVVHHSGGTDTVPVIRIDDPLIATVPLGGKPGGDALVKENAAETAAKSFDALKTANLSFNLRGVFETGRGESLERRWALQPRTSTGYSHTLSFDEALRDALKNLPPDPKPEPDELSSITVTDIGVETGGIAGITRLFVTVVTYDVV